MVKFLPPWHDSQKPLISVWKHLGSFSLSSGNKMCLICRHSQDRAFHRAQELLLTLLRCSRVSSCVPLPTLSAEGLPRSLHLLLPMNWQHLAHAATSLSSFPKAKDLKSGYVLLGFFFTPLQVYCRKLICCFICCFTTQSLFPPSSCDCASKRQPLSCSAAPPDMFGARLGSDRLCVVQLVLSAGKCQAHLACSAQVRPSHTPALPPHLYLWFPSPANLLLRLAPIHTQGSQRGCTGLLALANSSCFVSALSNISPVFLSVFSAEAAGQRSFLSFQRWLWFWLSPAGFCTIQSNIWSNLVNC